MNTIRWMRVGCVVLLGFGAGGALFSAENLPETGARAANTAPVAPAKVDLNNATVLALQTLPGIGPEEAQAIIAARPLKSEGDLEKIPGVGRDKARDLKPFVTVSKTKSSAVAQTVATKSKVDINQADLLTLESLPGVGPDIARAIVAARPFKSASDLDRLPGLSAERLEQIRAEITIEPAPATHRLGEPALEPTGRPTAQPDEKSTAPAARKDEP